MASNAPWSVKGIDPKTREAAKDHARRSGMTLGEWLNQRIREEAAGISQPDPIALPGQAEAAAPVAPKAASVAADSLSALTDRLDAAEQRSTLAITGLDQSVRGVLARMEGAEQTQEALRQKLEERLLKVEQDGAGPRSAEALRILETSLGKVAHRANDAEARLADSLDEMKREISALSRRLEGLEGTSAGTGVAVLEQRMEQLAITLTARVDAAKAELGSALDTTSTTLTARVDTAKAEMSSAVDAAGARAAHTVERIGHEVLRMADSLGRRVQGVENRSADAIEQVGGEVARVISSLEARMQKSDGAHAQALEKLGGEIARIAEKLSERIAHSERRAAQAIDDVGEQVTRTTERLNTRYDRASSDLAERIRQSEERTARLLEDAKERIDSRLADSQRRLSEQVAEVAAAAPVPPPMQSASFAERASFTDPFGSPPVIYPDAAPFGQTFAPAGFTPAEPDFARADMDAADNFATAMAPQSEADFVAAPVQTPMPEPSFERAYTPAPEAAFHTDSFTAEAFPAEAFPTAEAYSPEPYQPEAFAAPDPFKLQAFTPPAPEPTAYNQAPEAVSTRNMLDQARAAARAAAQPQGKTRSEKVKGGGLPFLGRKKNNLKNALMMGVAVVALGAVFTGAWSLGTFKGMLPARVANNLQRGSSVEYKGPETDTAPTARAAMALDPQPIEGSNIPAPVLTDPLPAAPNAMALYNDGAQKIELNDKSGVDQLKRAANLGLPAAQSYLGRLYEKGGSGLARDPTEARRWYERAAQAGDRSAMHNLGYYYFEGTAGPKNLTVAAEWFRRAAMLGLTDSQYNLARLYEGGLGVNQNAAEAYKWYLLASRAGTTEQRSEARTAANRVGAKISDEARANAERTVQTLSSQINASQDHAQGPVAPATTVSDLALAQRALVKLGYFKGAVDGQMSVALRLAVQSYQREKNIPATGLVDVVTIQSLRPYIG
jgi:localization factor PodJL